MDPNRVPGLQDTAEGRVSSERQARFLAEASRVLAASLDYETTLSTVAGMALPYLGAWCFVDLIEAGDHMRRLAVIHRDQELQELARRLESGWPPQRDDPLGAPQAMRTRRSEVIPEVTDQMLIAAAHGEENLRILRELGIGSLMIVPLIARDVVLGAITYVSLQHGHAYTEADLELAEDLALRCAMAIDNARLYRDALEAKAEAEEASRARSDFMATMSHEIRTPVNAVMGYADLLEIGVGGSLSKDQHMYVERIKSSNRHLLGLINDVLDVAKADAGRVQVFPEEAAAGTVVDAALDLLRPLVEGRSIALSSSCEGDPDVRFVGDVDRVRQIILNLLTNAAKFTRDGGRVRVSCGREPAPAGAHLTPGAEHWTFVRVEDTGIGVPDETLEQIFEPFVRAETGYSRSTQGSGLGLAISLRLARLMHGDITATSRPGEGSTFTLWLPAPDGDGSRAQPLARAADPSLPSVEQLRGVAAIGAYLLQQTVPTVRAITRVIRERRLVPHLDELDDALLQDHVASYLADIAQTLVLMEESVDHTAEILRDGSAIQRTIADRHGMQRQRIGWSPQALELEYDLLRSEIERVVEDAAREHPQADPERALHFLHGFLQQARRGSLRAFQMADRRNDA